MSRLHRTIRYVPIGFAALLVFTTAQAAWWILDQWWFTAEVQRSQEMLYEQQRRAGQQLLDRGASAAEIAALLPDLEIVDGRLTLGSAARQRLAEERRSRVNQYLWEGGFFMVVLLASVGVIVRALRDDARLRRRQQNFLAAVSHELKSPLASARVAAETLEMRGLVGVDGKVQLARVLRNIDRLEGMILNMLETVRIEEGSLALAPERHDLRETLEPVFAATIERARDVGVELAVEVPGGIKLRSDREAVRAVLRNLLDNALTAVRGRDDPVIGVDASLESEQCVLAVRDNGCGFEPAQAARLFEKFYRPGDEMRRGGRGAGLGLHIVEELVSRSGGAVAAYSEGPGRGALFRVTLPLARPRS